MSYQIYLLVIIITFALIHIIQLSFFHDVLAVSPSFVRQEIIDDPNDWQLWQPPYNTFGVPTHNGYSVGIDTAKNMSECKNEETTTNQLLHPDIESVSYISDGKKLNATIWLTSPFYEPPLNDSLDIYQEELQIKTTETNYTLDEFIDLSKASVFEIILDPDTMETQTTIAGSAALNITYFVGIGQDYQIQKTQLWSVIDNRAFNITYSTLLTNDTIFTNYITKINKMLDSFEIGTHNFSTTSSNENQYSIMDNDDFLVYQNNGISISYPSDWLKNELHIDNDQSSIISLKSPFDNEKVNEPSWHETFYTLALDIDSVHDVGTDYRIKISRIPNDTWTAAWTSQIQEVSAKDKNRVLMEYDNYTKFYEKESPYILFSFDLNTANFPKQYKAVLYITDHFVINHKFCRLVDMTNWIIIPPPEFVMTTAPYSIELRPGEEKSVQIKLKGNTDLESEAVLATTNQADNTLNVTDFSPQKMSIPPSEGGTSNLKLKVPKDASEQTYAIPISSNISFPSSITNTGGDTFSNNRSVSITESANLTLTILPPLSDLEKFQSLVTEVITPVAGVWTFLAGVGAVIIPLIIRIYNKRKKQNAKVTADSEEKK